MFITASSASLRQVNHSLIQLEHEALWALVEHQYLTESEGQRATDRLILWAEEQQERERKRREEDEDFEDGGEQMEPFYTEHCRFRLPTDIHFCNPHRSCRYNSAFLRLVQKYSAANLLDP